MCLFNLQHVANGIKGHWPCMKDEKTKFSFSSLVALLTLDYILFTMSRKSPKFMGNDSLALSE